MRKIAPVLFVLALLITSNALASPPAAPSAPATGVSKSTSTAPQQRPAVLPPVWGANYKANTDTETCNANYTNCAQHEPEIAINPHNNLNAIATFKDWRGGFKQIYIATTFDGGATWINQLPPALPYPNITNESDGVSVFGSDGIAYVSVLAYGGSAEGVYVTKSTNGGATWSNVVAAWVGGQGNADKDWLTIDTNPTSPYYNRLYATWTNLGQGAFNTNYSTDGGATWSTPHNLGGPTWVSIPLVLPNGDVLVTMYGETNSNITEAKSTNGGVSWSAQSSAVAITNVFCWITCTRGSNQQNWRMSTMQAAAVDHNSGNIYMVWLDGRNDPANGWDIYYSRSTDEGTTWSTPTRLNDDPTGHMIDQVLPTVAVAPDGTVHVAWMDKRDDPNNVLMNLYYTYSTDQGVTWQPDVRLSTASSDYNIGIPTDSNQAASDYIGIAAITDTVWITWLDTRNNQQDIYTIRGSTAGGGTPTPTATNMPTATNTPIATATPAATDTPPPTSTPGGSTNTPTSTATAGTTATVTPVATNPPTTTPVITSTASPSPMPTTTECANSFVDVNNNVFYTAIHFLNCRGVVNGTDATHYSPAGTATRGQFAKVVVLGFGTPRYTPATPSFTDVLPGYFAYTYIETGYHAGILSGFDQAGCQAHGVAFPCYLPNLAITRGQLTKLVVNAGGFQLTTPTGGGQDFSDVPPSNVFYVSIETAYHNSLISGYPDHTFHPNNNIRRDEMAQIVYEGLIHQPEVTQP